MHPWQQRGGGLPAAADHLGPVLVPECRQPLVAFPPIRDHPRSRLDGVGDEGLETSGGRIGDTTQANPSDALAIDLCRDSHQILVSQEPAPASGPDAPHIGLIDLHIARQPVPTRPYHGPPELLQTGPRGLVAAQPQQPLQSQGTHAMFLIGDPPHRAEPRSQRKMTAVEDDPGCDRSLMPAPCAHHEAPLGHPSICVDSALGALEARWPAQRRQIGSAGWSVVNLRSKSASVRG